MMARNSRENIYNCICDKCGDKGHSREGSITHIKLSFLPDPLSIRLVSKVCLRCGPSIRFEVSKDIAHVLEETLVMAGFRLNDKRLEIKEV